MLTPFSVRPLEKTYSELVELILEHGEKRDTRNHPTRSVYGVSFTLNELEDKVFPLLNGRQLYYKGVLAELAAFFKGPKHVKDFEKEGCHYWSKWADENGTLDLDYGNSWFNFNGINQMRRVVENLRNNPADRRHLVTGWNPGNLDSVSLPCCHLLYQWYVRNLDSDTPSLDMIWYQRSVDVMIGLPSDIILAAAWNLVLAKLLNLKPGKLTFNLGDTHIYEDHVEKAHKYLRQADEIMREPSVSLPSYAVKSVRMPLTAGPYFLSEFNADTIEILNYRPAAPIKFNLHG